MEQEDYLKRQIDQLGRVLGKILADLTGPGTRGQVSDSMGTVSQALKAALDLNLDELVAIPAETFLEVLKVERNMSSDSFEKLAAILFLVAEETGRHHGDIEKAWKFYEHALVIFEHLDKTSSTYSFDRHSMIMKIQKRCNL
ncbi:MAG: hypothetical protein WCK34_15905 [Bacteroidota bacterium]